MSDKRIYIIVRGGKRKVRIFTSTDYEITQCKERADGSGDLAFVYWSTFRYPGCYRPFATLYGIPDVRSVDRIVTDAFPRVAPAENV